MGNVSKIDNSFIGAVEWHLTTHQTPIICYWFTSSYWKAGEAWKCLWYTDHQQWCSPGMSPLSALMSICPTTYPGNSWSFPRLNSWYHGTVKSTWSWQTVDFWKDFLTLCFHSISNSLVPHVELFRYLGTTIFLYPKWKIKLTPSSKRPSAGEVWF